MDSSSTYSYDNDYEFNQLHDLGYDSLSASHFDDFSETSEEFFSIYEQTSTDSYFDDYEDDDISSSYSMFETDSSIDDFQSGSGNTSLCRTSDVSLQLSRRADCNEMSKPVLNGILKSKPSSIPTIISRDTIEKIRENELEDVLQNARDIVEPDPSAKMTFCTQPAKIIQGSFKHLLSVKEVHSKTGAFLHRTIEMTRSNDEDLGFSIRDGDGWEKESGIFISRVSLGSVFDQYGILAVGDEILQINKVDIKAMKINEVIRLMYVPRRLSITLKILTPFSKKRIADTKIDTQKVNKNRYTKHSISDNLYRVANLQIGPKKKAKNPILRTILVRNKHSQIHEEKNRKISPYRTMEGGKLPPTIQKYDLSPIKETNSETQVHSKNRKTTYVRWSDQNTYSD